MAELNYTKGEWYPTMIGGERRIVADKDNIEEVICYGVRHYNMNLIAAAPNMYKALKAIPNPKSILEDAAYSGGDVPKKWIKLRKQALAKAEGK